MASFSSKDPSTLSYPKSLLSIVTTVGGLAVFLILASSFLVSQPIGAAVHEYFYGVQQHSLVGDGVTFPDPRRDDVVINDTPNFNNLTAVGKNDKGLEDEKDQTSKSQDEKKEPDLKGEIIENSTQTPVLSESSHSVVQPHPESRQEDEESNNSSLQKESKNEGSLQSSDAHSEDIKSSSTEPNSIKQAKLDPECDLYHGKWISDQSGPLYRNDSCPVLTQMQNCQGNGRPDKDYENWRWKPTQCDLPRFDPKKFLELMRGKTLAFIGDSVARNQMESMLCILWQYEVPKNRGNKRMQRYYFRSTSTMIVRIWSSWLVNQTSGPLDFAPAGVVKLHLDVPDDGFMQYIPQFDVVVLSSGHWFAKQSVYVLNNEIVGGQLWWPDKSRKMKVNNVEAFGISVETILTAMATHTKFSGITIVRSFSPDHYEGGAWNTGGSCTGKVKPAEDGELVENGFTNIMHEKQFTGYSRAIKKKSNKSALLFMDITQVFAYRHDGHPGPYRSPDPNKITKRGPDGKPPPQDCLHWCIVDTMSGA
ncbi:protein YLS7 [Lycium ferocissimum]|uniref:protein YLS7 n=1 Tax=Lycium ferocissimum TaxID=112874 RepID=UPI0028153056|nr:protein YLS7 [Lycium ferocissimum]